MYLTSGAPVYHDGVSVRRQPRFLLLVQDRTKPCSRMNFRAMVRCTRLRQFGQFMMGSVRIKGKRITVSGAYGGDGLPLDVDPDVFAEAKPVPELLYELWAHGGGWNSAGGEGEWMRNWALSVFPDKRRGMQRRKRWLTLVAVMNADGSLNVGCKPSFLISRE